MIRVLILGGTGRSWGAGGGRSRAAGGVGCRMGGGGTGFGGELVRGALAGHHLFKHLLTFLAPFGFIRGGGGGEALLLAFKGGLLHS